jgi:hypothetical protein
MLIIREEQMKAFEDVALRNFENEMVEHIQQFAPQQSEIIGEPGVRKVVKLGIDRAGNYDFTNKGPVRFYLELMFMLGSDFDTDPQYPWVAEILNDQNIKDQMARAESLYNKFAEYAEKVLEPKNIYEKEALHRITRQRLKDFPMLEDSFENDVTRWLWEIYPEKCNYVGEPALTELVQNARLEANNYGINFCPGTTLVALALFAFGHGCLSDPQFPWIAETLSDNSIVNPEEKAEKILLKMKSYCDNALGMMTDKRK